MKQHFNEAELRLKAVIDTATDGIITISTRGIMESVNTAAAELFGYDPSEMIGQNVRMLMPEPHHSDHDGYLHNYLETRKPRIIGIGREVEGKRKDGSVFPMRLSVSEVDLADRKIFTGIIHDLSVQKANEDRIQKLNEQLERKVENRTEELEKAIEKLLDTNKQLGHEVAERKIIEATLRATEQEIRSALAKEKELNELKSRFVSMASHEFRTPLSSILSSAELIEAYTQTEQQNKRQKHINRIRNSVRMLTSILNDFLSLSRLEEGQIPYQPEEVDLDAFCLEIKQELEPLLKNGQNIIYQPIHNRSSFLLDRKMMRHVFYNLLSNASKYSHEEKDIYCKTRVEGSLLIISIIDEGIGIPQEDQGHMFTRFFRAHNVENIKGTGLGLTIVKRYVKLMGGTIGFHSIEGKGSTFTVSLPVKPS